MRSAWRSLTRSERRRVAAMLTAILAVNLAGWGTFVLEILPRHFQYKELGVGIGAAVTAWTLGLRHAFDADHIAAIDNSTRKLMADGQRPLGTGFFFALGHASVVMVVGVGITIAAKAVFGAVVTPSSTFESAGGVASTALSAIFLWLIAALNLPLLFAGGMMLCDSVDGLFMNFAYGWAFARPVRKVYYNLTITALSVAVAFLVGGVEIVGLLSTELHLHGWLGDYMASFDLNTAGFVIVGLFVLVWTVAVSIWRFGHVEARWEAAAARNRSALPIEETP
ncbi:MAG: hypothetical protein M3065_20655 [Actinomycetota bacterium]|nr:hypothetical protein [Actinomycetota bacterium]